MAVQLYTLLRRIIMSALSEIIRLSDTEDMGNHRILLKGIILHTPADSQECIDPDLREDLIQFLIGNKDLGFDGISVICSGKRQHSFLVLDLTYIKIKNLTIKRLQILTFVKRTDGDRLLLKRTSVNHS